MRKSGIIFLIASTIIADINAFPLIESKPLTSNQYEEGVQKIEPHSETDIDKNINLIIGLCEELAEKLDDLKIKIDNLEKQQRDFLLLISDIVMQPEQSIATQENKDYQTSLDLLKSQNYQQALKSLQKFTTDYPKSEKQPHAFYWIAEIYLLDHQFDQAKQCYSYLASTFPLHPKAAEALFKLGQIEYNQGQLQVAKQKWLELIERYPQSQATLLAKKNLAKVDFEEKH